MNRTRITPSLHAPLVAMLCLLLAAGPSFADSVTTTTSDGFGRALFTLDPPGKPVATVKDGVLMVRFGRKVSFSAKSIATGLSSFLSSSREDTDGRTFRFALAQPVRLHSSVSADKYALDLIPAGFVGTPPDLPPPPEPEAKAVNVAALPLLRVRAGAYANFTRLVFDWHRHVPYAVFPGANHITIRFEAKARPDFKSLERIAPPWIKQSGWRIEKGGTVIEFNTETQSGYHDFRSGNRIVLDILAPKTDASAYDPPGKGKAQAPVVLANADAKADAVISPAQASAILKTAETLNGKPPLPTPAARPGIETKASSTKPDETKAADAKPTLPTPKVEIAQVHRTREGASLLFPGAGPHGAAVFVRGMTAWIVLDGTRSIDPTYLITALGDFPSSVDAFDMDGVSVLRLGLKNPEEIAATTEGTALKVVIAPKVNEKATGIELSRVDDGPSGSALVTLLPDAVHAVTLSDPAAGDALIVVPGAAGRAMLKERRYVDFTALPSSAGLVITPFADDLAVKVHDMRVRIDRPGGLTMTLPQLPPAQSPAALAESGYGPSYINFAAWSHPVKGDILTEERALRDAAARLPADKANPARLTLARFYIANDFGAEALGYVNLMQATDPSLQDDKQLQTIRAAADVMMARYRDAYNALAVSSFDNDRHAALWRGLAQAALQDWNGARKSLEKAMLVLDRYPPAWQARARIAYANAAIKAGALEVADSALGHLPKRMPKAIFLDSELTRAGLYAAEGRYRHAHSLYAALGKSGNPQVAAHAIYDDVVAGLAAGAVTQNDAIERLEKLRYRWRGDSLELDTLRKLGALYFGMKRWRDGLQTLRIATQSFPNDDLARQAQNDMRDAFKQLFLKGTANKMPPIEALSLFYDFIDLTPIGADGDEMIRRMADRLVKVDLLGPAETLLKYQVDKRLDGVARAQVATRLAMIDLLDHKAKDALAALRTTRIAGLPDNIGHERLLLEARALAALKQWDQALDLIAVDNAPDTRRLRADIYWESGNWAVAAQKAEQLLGDRWSDTAPLSTEERHQVMRAAIAYSLANDETSLERLRNHFAAKMKASPDASAFTVVTQRIDTQGVAFRDVAGKIASIDTLESFMKDFKAHYDGAPATN